MNPNTPLKVRVSITLDENVAEEIRKLSDNEFRPFSQYINLVLAKHIKSVKENEKSKL